VDKTESNLPDKQRRFCMGYPIVPVRPQSASVKLAQFLEEIETRYGVPTPDRSTRKRIASRYLPAGPDGYLPFDHAEHYAVEKSYREAYSLGATIGSVAYLAGENIPYLLDCLRWDRLYYRLQASKQKTPESRIRQAQYRAIYQSVHESTLGHSAGELSRWLKAVHEWRDSIDDGLICPPFCCEVAA